MPLPPVSPATGTFMEANIVIVRLFTIDTGIKSEEIKVGRLPWQGYPIKNERNADRMEAQEDNTSRARE